MQSIELESFSPSTQIYCNKGVVRTISTFLSHRAILIADRNVPGISEVAEMASAALLTLEGGESVKSEKKAKWLVQELMRLKADRETTLIAMGGGTVTDLVSFVASVYLRGMPLILVPTTLLAMVDAAIGGKNAINTRLGKNLIGTFYFPKTILIDPAFLQTLPEQEWFHGRVEMWKLGLISDVSLWEKPDLWRAIQGKCSIVRRDPKDQGERRILNFGHTIGHALEKLSNYQLPHGEAVAIGCVAESHLSYQMGYLSYKEFRSIADFYSCFPLALPKCYARQSLQNALLSDKKRVGNEVRFVLIDRIGHAMPFDGAYCRKISWDQCQSTLDWLEDTYQNSRLVKPALHQKKPRD
ncbi:MAG: 3-dehydroquinate synthase [Verrucomicrobiota bacterium]|nr:3-dehydroquinate synthase [Verrucomicrobiota bacterium]